MKYIFELQTEKDMKTGLITAEICTQINFTTV